jgi:hypothetical protein
MTREEMIALVRRVQALEVLRTRSMIWFEFLSKHVPHARIGDLIHYPPIESNLTAEQVVDEALRREAEWRPTYG